MNRYTSKWLFRLGVSALAVFGLYQDVRAAEALRSPDGRVVVEVTMQEDAPHWTVSYQGDRFIRGGMLGVATEPDRYSGKYDVLEAVRESNDTQWKAVAGELSVVRDHYNQLTLKLREKSAPHKLLHVVLRAYNEGVGLRYVFPAQPGLKEVTVQNRLTQYDFAQDYVVYQNRKWEYGVNISTMHQTDGVVTLDIGNGAFAGMTDADRSNFSMIAYGRRAEDPANRLLGRVYSSSSGALPFHTSWEVIILGDTLGNLYENRFIVDNLNPPCAIEDTSWISWGVAISQVRNVERVTAQMKKLLDFASRHKIPFMEIDHSWNGTETKWTPEEIENFEKNKGAFWDDKPSWRDNVLGNPMVEAKGWVPFRPNSYTGGNFVDLDLTELAAYGKTLNPPVGVLVYVRGAQFKEFGGDYPIDEVFSAYAKMGLAGAKPGFVPARTQENEKTIAYLVANAAKHKLLLCIHDDFYPYGLERTYPNLVNIEGVAGQESEHNIPPELQSIHDVMLPFTRLLMGPADYTPEIGIRNHMKTHCHQVAMLATYHGRPTLRRGMQEWSPGGSWDNGTVEFVEDFPSLFDEKKVVAEANKHVTVARRSGNRWYVGGMSANDPITLEYPLNFLKPGQKYQATILSDIPGSIEAKRTVQEVTSKSIIPLSMNAHGGHLMIIDPL